MKTASIALCAVVAGVLAVGHKVAVAGVLAGSVYTTFRPAPDPGAWVIGFLVTGWLLISFLVCFYWLLVPTRSPLCLVNPGRWTKWLCRVVILGGFIGCMTILASGTYLLLWFIPVGESVSRGSLAFIIGLGATAALSYRLHTDLERNRGEARVCVFRREVANEKRKLEEGTVTLVDVTRRIAELWQRVDKLSPIEYIQMNALEHVWHEAKDLRENIRRIRELEALEIKGNLNPYGTQQWLNLAAEFEESYGNEAIQPVLDSKCGVEDLIEEIEDDLTEEEDGEAAQEEGKEEPNQNSGYKGIVG